MESHLRKWLGVVLGVVRSVLFIINNLYAIPVYLVWMLLLCPLARLTPAFFWWFEGFLFHSLVTMAGILSHTASYQLVEVGDTLDDLEDEHCLFLCNHQSTADVPMLMTMLAARGTTANHVFWIMDAIFRWTHFGMVSQCRGDFFVECGKEKRDKSVEELKGFLLKNYVALRRRWIILFPEGGFLRKRRAASQRFADKLGLPRLQHVTLPRVGAAGAVMQQLGPTSAVASASNGRGDVGGGSGVRYVVDMTIAYPEPDRPLHLLSLMMAVRPACTIYHHYRVYPAREVPTDPERLTTWLYDRYMEKEAALAEYYRTGVFPPVPGCRSAASPPRPLRLDMLDYLLREVFFLGSVLVQARLVGMVWTALTSLW